MPVSREAGILCLNKATQFSHSFIMNSLQLFFMLEIYLKGNDP
jgi:hypothetical protein